MRGALVLAIVLLLIPVLMIVLNLIAFIAGHTTVLEFVSQMVLTIVFVLFPVYESIPTIFMAKGKTMLRIDRKTISVTYSIFGRSYQRPEPTSRNEITKIERIERGMHYKRGERFEQWTYRQSDIRIHTRDRTFKLNFPRLNPSRKSAVYLSSEEYSWLFDEISDWLAVPTEVTQSDKTRGWYR